MKTVKTPEQFKLQFQTLHPTLELLSDYINSTSTIKVKCKICGKEWTPRADTLKKIKCTTCEKSNKYKQQIAQINPNIEILDPIIYKTHDNIEVKCKNCGRIWFSRAGKLLEGQKCICNSESKGELLVKSILKKINIDFIQEYMLIDSYFSQYKLYIDFYIPSKNLFIEYNGIQHYQPVDFGTGGNVEDIYNKQITRDSELKEYCDLHNIKLLEIKYTLNEDEVENLIKETLNII